MTMIRNTAAADLANIAAICGTRVYLEAGYCPGFQMRIGAEMLRINSRSNPMWWEDVATILPEIERAVKALPNFEDNEALWAWVNSFPRNVQRKLHALWGFEGPGLGVAGLSGAFRAAARNVAVKDGGSGLDAAMYTALISAVYKEEARQDAFPEAICMAAAMTALAKAGAPTAFVLSEVRKNLDWNWTRWIEGEEVTFVLSKHGIKVIHPSGAIFILRERDGGKLTNAEDVRVLRNWLQANGLLQQAAA